MSDCTHGNLTAHGRECPWCKNETLQARIEALEAGLNEAICDIEDWGAYAADYFQQKHDLKGCVAGHKALLQETNHE